MNKKMVVGFLGLFAKLTNPTIIPISPPQPIRRPKPILQRKPRMMLGLGRCPNMPNNFVEV
jgi:hypothetical protein